MIKMFANLFLEEQCYNIYSMIIKLIKYYFKWRIENRMNW